MSLTNINRKFGYGQYSSDRNPWHCFRSFHLRSGSRAYKVWKLYTGYTPLGEYINPDIWKEFFPSRSEKISPEYVQLTLF